MAEIDYKYVIVGGGIAGAYAVEGIREMDQDGPILILGEEKLLPYDRPPLSKKLWAGKKKIEDIFPHNSEWYLHNNADVKLGVKATGLHPDRKVVCASDGNCYHFERCLLATGGTPRKLDIPGWDIPGICYYRYLDDYLRMRISASEGASAVVIGGGFIGSELAAAFRTHGVDVTMIFPERYIAQRVFPESFGLAIQDLYVQKGVHVLTGDIPVSFEHKGGRFVTCTRNGRCMESDLLLVGAGILPNVGLAKDADLEVTNGVVVNEMLTTSHPDIFAAGDIAFFPYPVFGDQRRVEHWDNALNQGRYAGRNMAGANQAYDYMPYFWSDLFEIGYEAIGNIDSGLQTHTDWIEPNVKGIIYYLQGGSVAGVMTANIYGKMDAIRDALSTGQQVTPSDLAPIFRDAFEKAA